MRFQPIALKALVTDCDIKQSDIAKLAGVSRPAVNLAINRGYMPERKKDFREIVEEKIRQTPKAMQWLLARGRKVEDVWEPLGRDLRNISPAGAGARAAATKKRAAITAGNPNAVTINWEVEMIQEETKRHFKLFKNPFLHDILEEKDIYMTDEHRYIEASMLDAAKHAGFLAIVGEVQSGKSVIRRKVVMALQRDDNMRVIFPAIVDKTRVTATSLGDAIVSDISDEKAKIRQEQQARQVHRLLLNRHKQGYRHVLIIEEAHDLPLSVLKLLKRFYELEDGYEKLLGIILIGQPELRDKLHEGNHPDMREVIRRVQLSEIKGLNGDLKGYLGFKFKRIQSDVSKVFADGAIEALSRRMQVKDQRTGKTISNAYPGLVNNYAAKAMNLAFEMGEKIVTEAVVNAI
ncbi:MAG: ExeA family protein [Deltaproteobacteria bacterium]|nr:ExeA family protein [Deltaproteobacteria bacterium]